MIYASIIVVPRHGGATTPTGDHGLGGTLGNNATAWVMSYFLSSSHEALDTSPETHDSEYTRSRKTDQHFQRRH